MKKIAPLLILLAGVLWGCLGIFVRKLNTYGLYAMEIVHLRAVVTSIGLGLFLLAFDRKLFRIHWKDIWCFLGTGLCSIVFFNYCYFKAISMTSMAVAAVLLYTAPAIVMVLSFFLFHEKFSVKKLIALILTFIGCLLVTGILSDQGTISGSGILVGLGAGFGYALYSIFSRYALNKGYHSLTITFYTFLIAGLGTMVLSDFGVVYETSVQSISVLLLCIALGILGTVVPYLTYTTGLKYVENSKASIIASIEPVTAALIGMFLFQEDINFQVVLGIVLVLAALVILGKGNRTGPEKLNG